LSNRNYKHDNCKYELSYYINKQILNFNKNYNTVEMWKDVDNISIIKYENLISTNNEIQINEFNKILEHFNIELEKYALESFLHTNIIYEEKEILFNEDNNKLFDKYFL
jgi:hypothetical protein